MSTATRADWDPAKHPRIPGGKGGGRFTSEPHGRPGGAPWTRHGKTVTYHGSMGIDRSDMPQLSGIGGDGQYHPSAEMVPQFIEHLRSQGIPVTERRVDPESLRPTQTEGDMPAIRRIADSLKSGELADTKPVTVSADGRVLDGHHNWAARVLAGREGGREGLPPAMRVVQVGLPMDHLIAQARGFGVIHGIRQRKTGEIANPAFASLNRWDHEWITLGAESRPGPVSAAAARARAALWRWHPRSADGQVARYAVGGHHVPGTDYNWEHGWSPLTLTAAKSHYHNRVPPHWTPGGQRRPVKVSGKMSHGDWHEGYQAVAQAPSNVLGSERTRHVRVPGEEHTHAVTGSWSDPWWMTNGRGGWAVSRRWKHKAQTGTDWTPMGHGGKARSFDIPAADERVLTPVDATGVPLKGEGPGGAGDRVFATPELATANAEARAAATGQPHYATKDVLGTGNWTVTGKRPGPFASGYHEVDAEGNWRRHTPGARGGNMTPSGPPGSPELPPSELGAAAGKHGLEGDAAHEHLGTPSLSKAQRDTVERYQGSLYHQMDAYLNTGDIHAADDEMGSHVISEPEMRKQIALLDSAFKAAPPTTKPMTVYRGMIVPDAAPGATWTDKTPVSTTTDRAIGDQYASWAADAGQPGAMTVRIAVPAGSKALSMMNMIGGDHPQAIEEREVLLPRGSRFRVIAVSGNIVEAELLPSG